MAALESCAGCGRRAGGGCLGLTDGCRYRILLAAARRLLVDGADLAKCGRTRGRHRALARNQMRAILDATDPGRSAARARETWPAWARDVDSAVEGRAA